MKFFIKNFLILLLQLLMGCIRMEFVLIYAKDFGNVYQFSDNTYPFGRVCQGQNLNSFYIKDFRSYVSLLKIATPKRVWQFFSQYYFGILMFK